MKMHEGIPTKKIFKIAGIILVFVIILIIAILIYNKIMTEKNTDDFYNYLLNNGYTDNKDGTYTKDETKEDKNIEYLFSKDAFILSKSINYDNTNISLDYNNNDEIEAILDLMGMTQNGDYGSTVQMATYKNGKFECKIILDDGFGSKCDVLKKEVEIFNDEINELLEKSKTNYKYIEKNE